MQPGDVSPTPSKAMLLLPLLRRLPVSRPWLLTEPLWVC